jgi:hypothetical protein
MHLCYKDKPAHVNKAQSMGTISPATRTQYIYLNKLYIYETHTCHAVASQGQRVRTAQAPLFKPNSTSLHVMALAIELLTTY